MEPIEKAEAGVWARVADKLSRGFEARIQR